MKTISRIMRASLALLLLGFASGAVAATRSYTLYITAGNLTVNGAGGTTMSAWSYTDVSGSPKWPGPALTAYEGDTVTITVINNHTINHNFVIQGVTTDATAIAPGGNRVYSFTAINRRNLRLLGHAQQHHQSCDGDVRCALGRPVGRQ